MDSKHLASAPSSIAAAGFRSFASWQRRDSSCRISRAMADSRLRRRPRRSCAVQEGFAFVSIRAARHVPKPNRKIAEATELHPVARSLWEALRAWRLEEARRQELPPYVIFHDSTLIEVARRRPVSITSLATIPGAGASKLERYGSAIIEIVSRSK